MLVRLFDMRGVVIWKMVPGEIFTINEKRRSWNCLLEKEVTTANLKTINRQLWRTGRQPWVYCYLLPAWPFAQTHWFKVHFRNYNTEETASSWCVLLQDPNKPESVRNCRGDHRQEEKCNLSTRISPPFPPPVNRVTPSPNLPPPGCQRSIVTRSCHSQPTQPPLPIPPKQCVTQPLKPVKLGPTSIVVKLEPLRKVG